MRLATCIATALAFVVFYFACTALGQFIDQWIIRTVGV